MNAHWHDVEVAGHAWRALHVAPAAPRRALLWLPALGVPARNYEAFARALAERGVAVLVHEWRGMGSSALRASRRCDWGYRELLHEDIPASRARLDALHPELPVAIGGHSLGGQLASCSLALAPGIASALWLVASGSPFWRVFPGHYRLWLPLAYRALPALAQACGALPGRRIGFGGQEARGMLRDWSRTALSGRYGARGLGDFDAQLRDVRAPASAVLLAHDWFAPAGSLDYLLDKMQPSARHVTMLDDATLGARADHFAWMRKPAAVADALVRA